jgi:hypothetical protein
MKYFLNLLLLLVVLTPCEAQKFKPQLNLAKGDTYYMASTGTSAIVQSVNGQENKVNILISSRMAFKVIGVMDSVYNMEVSYQSLETKIQMADTTIDMDSKKNSPLDIPSSIIAAMINKPFNITLTRSGKIRSVENIEKMITSVFDGFPQIDTAKKEQIKKQFMQSFGANTLKSSLEMGTAIFPKIAVAKNDKWTVNTSLEAPAKASVQTVYQLIDISGGFYQIHGEGAMTSDKNTKPLQINGLPMKYNLSGTTLTDIKVNKSTGWISEVKLKQLMSGNIEILDNPQMPGGMTIPMTFNTEVTTVDK